jgi:hypothetical protein
MEPTTFTPTEIQALLREFRDARYALLFADGSEHTRLLIRSCALESFAATRGYKLSYGHTTGSAYLYHADADQRHVLTPNGEAIS